MGDVLDKNIVSSALAIPELSLASDKLKKNALHQLFGEWL